MIHVTLTEAQARELVHELEWCGVIEGKMPTLAPLFVTALQGAYTALVAALAPVAPREDADASHPDSDGGME